MERQKKTRIGKGMADGSTGKKTKSGKTETEDTEEPEGGAKCHVEMKKSN